MQGLLFTELMIKTHFTLVLINRLKGNVCIFAISTPKIDEQAT